MRISVVIPLYNKATYVERAVCSVLAQTRSADEIIVVDDGSTDGGPVLVEAIASPIVRLVRQVNAGVSAARNVGVAMARGDYIAFLDADDRYLPGFVETILGLASEFPQAALVGTAFRIVRPDGRFFLPRRHRSVARRGLVPEFHAAWSRSAFASTSSLAVKRSVLADPALRFPVGEGLGEDQDLWFRLAERFQVAVSPVIQSEYYIGIAGSTNHLGPARDTLPCYQRLRERLASGMVPSAQRAGARRLLASHLLNVALARVSHGDLPGAVRMLGQRASLGNPFYWCKAAARIGLAAIVMQHRR